MSVSCGFYNSLSGDRVYDAEQISKIFDGIINDGVYMQVGSHLAVSASDPADMSVVVGSGRAWFNHTWTYNDAPIVLDIDNAEAVLNRYDAVVLEVNADVSTRENTIRIVKGTPATSPVYPAMVNTEFVHQYTLAYVYVPANASAITVSQIINAIGTAACPYVTGPLTSISANEMFAGWETEWNIFMATKNAAWNNMDSAWSTWFNAKKDQATSDVESWINTTTATFEAWFEGLQVELDGNVAASLAERISQVEADTAGISGNWQSFFESSEILLSLSDHSGNLIGDYSGTPILARKVFAVL